MVCVKNANGFCLQTAVATNAEAVAELPNWSGILRKTVDLGEITDYAGDNWSAPHLIVAGWLEETGSSFAPTDFWPRRQENARA